MGPGLWIGRRWACARNRNAETWWRPRCGRICVGARSAPVAPPQPVAARAGAAAVALAALRPRRAAARMAASLYAPTGSRSSSSAGRAANLRRARFGAELIGWRRWCRASDPASPPGGANLMRLWLPVTLRRAQAAGAVEVESSRPFTDRKPNLSPALWVSAGSMKTGELLR